MRASTALTLAAAAAVASAAPALNPSDGELAARHVPHEFGVMRGGPGMMHHGFGPRSLEGELDARQGPGFGGHHFGGGHFGGMHRGFGPRELEARQGPGFGGHHFGGGHFGGMHRGFGPRELGSEQLEARQGPGFGGHHGGHFGGGMHRGFGPRELAEGELEARQGPGFGGHHFGGGHFGGGMHRGFGPRELTDELEARWGPGPMEHLGAQRHNPGYGGFHRSGNIAREVDEEVYARNGPVVNPVMRGFRSWPSGVFRPVIARDVDDELIARWRGGMGGGFGGRFHPQRSLTIDELD